MKKLLPASIFMCVTGFSSTALAQTDLSSDITLPNSASATDTFPAAYFAEYSPRTAADMIAQVPGFSIEEREDARGLGQGGANILLNNARLAGKSRAQDLLARISATNVVRIEIIDGANLDIPGLSGRIANIITENSGISGVWNWEPEWRSRTDPTPYRGSASVSGERGTLAYTVNAELENEFDQDEGFGLYYIGDDLLDQNSLETVFEEELKAGLGVDLAWNRLNGHVATVTGDVFWGEFNEEDVSELSRADGAPETTALESTEFFAEDSEKLTIQFDADYALPFLFGELKLIASWRDEFNPAISRSTLTEDGVLNDTRLVDEDQDVGERILRSEFSWLSAAGSDFQLNAEGAFNFLDNSRTTVRNDDSPATTADRVEERRAEVNLTYGRAVTPKLALQSSIGAEYSELSQTGGSKPSDADAFTFRDKFVRDFVRPKGFVNLSYAVDETLTLRGNIEREVGQLNFNDFLDSVDLQNALDTASNPDLVPEQSWLAETELDKDFGQGNRFSARIYGAIVEDVVDSIPIGDAEAVGNLEDTAYRWGVEFNSALRGERWGLDGIQADLSLALRDSALTDPLTRESRQFSNSGKYDWSARIRHDVPATDWAYGFGASRRQSYRDFGLGREVYRTSKVPRSYVFVEHKDFMGVNIEARIMNLLGETNIREQINYDGRRAFSDVRNRAYTDVQRSTVYRIGLSGTF